jgi:transposase InsO family protein
VLDALEQALHDRRPAHRGGLVHDSDRGSQYLSIKYTERLVQAGVEPSVGSLGDSDDIALVNGPRNLPSFGPANFPTLAGLVISRLSDR